MRESFSAYMQTSRSVCVAAQSYQHLVGCLDACGTLLPMPVQYSKGLASHFSCKALQRLFVSYLKSEVLLFIRKCRDLIYI